LAETLVRAKHLHRVPLLAARDGNAATVEFIGCHPSDRCTVSVMAGQCRLSLRRQYDEAEREKL
jgi:hypothetical protein